uniref:Putative secreted protein n=1 Tax=Panstrongylus lignarius TaxID=156445 RepID=A0A224XPZ8_9HEMI
MFRNWVSLFLISIILASFAAIVLSNCFTLSVVSFKQSFVAFNSCLKVIRFFSHVFNEEATSSFSRRSCIICSSNLFLVNILYSFSQPSFLDMSSFSCFKRCNSSGFLLVRSIN